MPKMMPPDFDPEWSPVSEEIVFRAAKERLSDDWYVFHSFHFTSDDLQGRKKDGEIDFLFYHPDEGIVVMEVKGGAISYHDNQWYQDDRPIEPVKQTIRNKYFIVNLLSAALNRHASISVAHSVCFPGCHGKKDWPAELSGFVLTGDTLPQIEVFLKYVLSKTPFKPTPENPAPSKEEVLHALSPYLDFGNKLCDRIANEKKHFFRLTDRQCAALDILENFDDMLIRGCAGSGKTIMAVKLAQRLAVQGKSVLLLCYNQLLARRLQIEVREYPGITAAAFFEFCIERLNIPEEKIARYRFNPRLYSEVLPQALQQLLYSHPELCFDAVIVDEGQDFAKEAWNVISLMHVDGGKFFVFCDPDQNIFQDELALPDFGPLQIVLKKNCRNTKNIFEAMKPYGPPDAICEDRSPVGAEVRELTGNCRELLAVELNRLIKEENVPPANIVILGTHVMHNTSIGNDPWVGGIQIVSHPLEVGEEKCVQYYTYMKYKGCESAVVILLDVDDKDPRWADHKGLYTAMSRATNQLIILHPESATQGSPGSC